MTVEMRSPYAAPAKLIYLVTEDWYFWSHRLPMARAARDAGFDVSVATRVGQHGERIRAEGFGLHALRWRRGSVNPMSQLAAVREIARLYRRERPDIVHHVSMKPVVLGGLAARWAGVPAVVNALTGLGTVFIANGVKARLARPPFFAVLGRLLKRPASHVIMQNEDDRRTLLGLGLLTQNRVTVLPGSGVDGDAFPPLPDPPSPPIVAAFVGRMLEDKGVRTLVEAQQALWAKGTPVDLHLVGPPDPENVTSIPLGELDRWNALPGISWLGQRDDIRSIWEAAHIAVLPSRREGLPKSLLEAASCGRPIIATDVPGCREVAREGENALLVPPDDPAALADALATLASDGDRRRRFGTASRSLVQQQFLADQIGSAVVALYTSIVAPSRRAM